MQNAQATTNSRSNHSKILSILIGFCCVLATAAAVASLTLAPLHKRCLGKSMGITHAIEFDAGVIYAQSHSGCLPDAHHWEESLYPHKTEAEADAYVKIPTLFWERPRRLAMNAALSNRNINTLKHRDKAILLYESVSPQHDASDNIASLPPCEARGGMSIATGFADGHVEEVPCAYRARVLKNSLAAMK